MTKLIRKDVDRAAVAKFFKTALDFDLRIRGTTHDTENQFMDTTINN
jgi:hypothetical protein